MASELEFRSDLYRGTARFYDEFRLGYPQPLLDDLCVRSQISGAGRLLDLGCGTGQITFELVPNFVEIWAVDQEPETVEFARAKAVKRGIESVRWIVGRAEDVDAEGSFELVAIGNAFHRLQRRAIAESAMRWLAPGGHLALLWSTSPWDSGSLPWQQAIADAMRRWMREAATADRLPADLEQHLAGEPHATVLANAGFTIVGVFDFPTTHVWSADELIGFMYSTSIFSLPALGPNAQAFESDLRARLLEAEPSGAFGEEIDFSYTLARRS